MRRGGIRSSTPSNDFVMMIVFVALSEAKDLRTLAAAKRQVLRFAQDDNVWWRSVLWPPSQALCMRAGQIAILSIAFSGLLSAQTAPQGSMGSQAKIPAARTEKKSPAPKLAGPVPVFRDIAFQAGLNASHISSREKYYVIESMSGGVGLFDCDNDGKLDIVMVNGSTVDRYKQSGGDPLVTLWHPYANLNFTHFPQKSRLTLKRLPMCLTL